MLMLKLPHEVLQTLLRELQAADSQEIGGILMGEQLAPGRFRVTEISVQRHSGWIARFIRSARDALEALQRFFERSGHRYAHFNYLGEWHSHPSFAPTPSASDHASMLEIASDPKTGANFVVLLIVKLNRAKQLVGSVTVYLPDGTVSAGSADIEGQDTDSAHPSWPLRSSSGDDHPNGS